MVPEKCSTSQDRWYLGMLEIIKGSPKNFAVFGKTYIYLELSPSAEAWKLVIPIKEQRKLLILEDHFPASLVFLACLKLLKGCPKGITVLKCA